jgi:hypothetical protein
MNPTLYALCQESIFGPVLWAMSLCVFSPPLKETPIAISTAGTAMSATFQSPIGKSYFLSAIYTFPSTEERLRDEIVGARHSTEPCYGKDARQFDAYPESARSSLGRPLRLKVTIKSAANNQTVYSQNLASVCKAGHDGRARKTQVIALIELPEGQLSIEVENLEPRNDLGGLRPALIIHPGGK